MNYLFLIFFRICTRSNLSPESN